MGSECYCWGYVRRSDWEAFRTLTGVVAHTPLTSDHHTPTRPGAQNYTLGNVDRALYEPLEAAAEAGLVYVAFNSRCEEYTSGVTVSTGDGEQHMWDIGEEGTLLVEVDEWGEVKGSEQVQARTVASAIREVQRLCRKEMT